MTAPLQVVPLPSKQRESALSEAEALLEGVQEGRIVGFTAVLEHPDGTYSVGGPATLSRLQSAGALLDAAITRLSKP